MKHLISILLIIACASLFAESIQIVTPGGNIGMTVTDDSVYRDGKIPSGSVIDNIELKLQELEKSYVNKLNKMDQRKAKRLMDDIYDLLSLLPTNDELAVSTVGGTATSTSTSTSVSTSTSSSTAVNDTNMNININVSENVPNNDQEHHKPHGKPHGNNYDNEDEDEPVVLKAMPEKDFNLLISKVRAESFSDNQLRVIRTATKNANYNVGQIIRMMDVLTYSDDKIEALRIMYPKVTDPANNFQILDALTYSTDKARAEEIINQ